MHTFEWITPLMPWHVIKKYKGVDSYFWVIVSSKLKLLTHTTFCVPGNKREMTGKIYGSD